MKGRPLLSLLAACAGLALASAAEVRAQSTEEIYLHLRHEGIVNALIVGRYDEGLVYLPLTQLFGELGLEHRVEGTARVIGFYIDESRSYELDLASGIARVGGRQLTLEPGEYIAAPTEIYVLPALLERLFGLRISIEMSTLTAVAASDETLPVVTAERRRSRGRRLNPLSEDLEPLPLRFDRRRALLNGGNLQYRVAASSTRERTELGFDLGAGIELLGGDLRAQMNGGVSGGQVTLRDESARWRYVLDPAGDRLVSSVTAGRMLVGGPLAAQVVGVRISNEPVQIRRTMGDYVIEGVTGPGWEVELYRDMELVAYARADPTGRFRFPIPLSYGSSVWSVREYGPTGLARSEEYRIQVPFALLPAGRTEYQVTAGRISETGSAVYQARAAGGLSDRFTARAGFDWRPNMQADQPVLTLGLSGRLGRGQIFDLEITPDAVARLGGEWYFGPHGHVGLNVAQFADNPTYNPVGRLREVQGRAFWPFPVGRAGTLGARVTGFMIESYGAEATALADLEASLSRGSNRWLLGYRSNVLLGPSAGAAGQEEVRLGMLYHHGGFPLGGRLRGFLVDGNVRYDLGNSTWRTQLGASTAVGSNVRLAIRLDHDPSRHGTSAEVGMVVDAPFARWTASARSGDAYGTVAQELRGTIGLDAGTRQVLFTRRESLGLGGATVRMFVDENANGTLDPRESLVPNGSLRMERSVPVDESAGGLLRVHELLPYERYDVYLDEAAVANPLLSLPFESFSFVVDPNAYKTIDIPLRPAAVLEGSVTCIGSEGARPVPGLRIHVRSLDDGSSTTLVTYSDGAFYEVGVPAGRYELAPDSAQLDVLGAASSPSSRVVSLSPAQGIGGSEQVFDFQLEPLPSREPSVCGR